MIRQLAFSAAFLAFLGFPPASHACLMSDTTIEEQFQNRDVDKNGSLSKDEYFRNVPPRLVPPKKQEETYKALDANKDGSISLDEFKSDAKNLRCGG